MSYCCYIVMFMYLNVFVFSSIIYITFPNNVAVIIVLIMVLAIFNKILKDMVSL